MKYTTWKHPESLRSGMAIRVKLAPHLSIMLYRLNGKLRCLEGRDGWFQAVAVSNSTFCQVSGYIIKNILRSLRSPACNKQNDNELCDLAAALETSSGRSIQHVGSVGTSVPITDVLLRHAEAAASAGPSNVKLDIRLLNECAGHNCTGQLDVSHGGVRPL